jgi:hypothetical protein
MTLSIWEGMSEGHRSENTLTCWRANCGPCQPPGWLASDFDGQAQASATFKRGFDRVNSIRSEEFLDLATQAEPQDQTT